MADQTAPADPLAAELEAIERTLAECVPSHPHSAEFFLVAQDVARTTAPRLLKAVQAALALTRDSDGNYLPPASSVPVGEFVAAITEALLGQGELATCGIELECPSCHTDDPEDFRGGCEDPWHAEARSGLLGKDGT